MLTLYGRWFFQGLAKYRSSYQSVCHAIEDMGFLVVLGYSLGRTADGTYKLPCPAGEVQELLVWLGVRSTIDDWKSSVIARVKKR